MYTDYNLQQLAQAVNGESFVVPNYMGVGTTSVSAFASTATAIYGEIGSRIATSKTRSSTTVTMSSIRLATSVVNTTSGDALTNYGLMASTSAGTVLIGDVLQGVTQTTAFDLEIDAIVTYVRPS